MKLFALLKVISFTLLFLALSSCGCHRHLQQDTTVRDSVIIRYHDSTVWHVETIRIELPKESSSAIAPASDTSYLETSLAASEAYVDSAGALHHQIWNLPTALEKEIEVPEHFHEHELESSHTETTTVTVEVERQLTAWQKFWITGGKIFALIILVSVVFLLIKMLV